MAGVISPEAIMAMAVLKAKDAGSPLKIEDISGLFLDLKKKGVNFGQVALRKVPGGVYSEDVEAFVGRLLAAGYATARSPIDFLEDGLRICWKILESEDKENPEVLRTLATILDFKLSPRLNP